jgi:hypothetical protein
VHCLSGTVRGDCENRDETAEREGGFLPIGNELPQMTTNPTNFVQTSQFVVDSSFDHLYYSQQPSPTAGANSQRSGTSHPTVAGPDETDASNGWRPVMPVDISPRLCACFITVASARLVIED